MPIVPVEENKVGLAGLTDAKLRPADYSGSGLEALGALGAGLTGLGSSAADFAASLPRPSPAEAAHARLLRTDLAAKQAWNEGHEGNAALLDGFRQLKGPEARAALAPVAEAMAQNLHTVRHGHEDAHVRAIIDGTLAHRTAQDIIDLHAHADAQDAIAQAQESERLVANAATDALRHADDPARFDHAIATGENALRRQGELAGKPEAAIDGDIAAWRSARYVEAVHALAPSDGLGATALFERYRDQLTPADRAALEPLLHEPMAQTQAIADIDTAALAAAPFAPLTPKGDPLLADRMRTITPHFDRVVLPELMQRYGGDAARAWAATQIGADAVDDLVKQHGDGWYQALPEAARHAVAHNFALLGAGRSARAAPQDRAAVEASLAGLDPARRDYAGRELALRSNRAEQARRAAQTTATDQAYDLADQLGHDFTSLAQLPAKVRADLPDQTSTALQRQADANIDPQPVAPEGAVSLALRNMATTAPEAFRDLDLREYRPLVSADEYAMFHSVQQRVPVDQTTNETVNTTRPSTTTQPHQSTLPAGDNQHTILNSPHEDRHPVNNDEAPHELLNPQLLASLQSQADVETQQSRAASTSPDTKVLRSRAAQQRRTRRATHAIEDQAFFSGSRYSGLGAANREAMTAASARDQRANARATQAGAAATQARLEAAPQDPIFPSHQVILPNGKRVPDSNPKFNTNFLLSPQADLRPIAIAGRAAGVAYRNHLASPNKGTDADLSLMEDIGLHVGTGGRFDYQRSGSIITGFRQLRQFRNVSNFNVGLFMQQTGAFSLAETLQVAGDYAQMFSSNSRTDRPYGLDDDTAKWIRAGYEAGRSGVYGPATDQPKRSHPRK